MTDSIKEPIEISKQARINEMVVRKFFEMEPDAANVLFMIEKFAKSNPTKYTMFKNMLKSEVKKTIKK